MKNTYETLKKSSDITFIFIWKGETVFCSVLLGTTGLRIQDKTIFNKLHSKPQHINLTLW